MFGFLFFVFSSDSHDYLFSFWSSFQFQRSLITWLEAALRLTQLFAVPLLLQFFLRAAETISIPLFTSSDGAVLISVIGEAALDEH
jgi:hypothetical protein